jgi:Sulfatase.
LIIKLPGIEEAKVERTPVSTLDLYQTILDYAGAVNENRNTCSDSLKGFLENTASLEAKDVYSVIGAKKESVMSMLRNGRYKLIRLCNKEGALYELYDLEKDQDEIHDLWKTDKVPTDIKLELKNRLDAWTLNELKSY